jgi:hypothetical protein
LKFVWLETVDDAIEAALTPARQEQERVGAAS